MVEAESSLEPRCTYTDQTVSMKLSPEEMNAAMSAMSGMLAQQGLANEDFRFNSLLGQGSYGKVIQAEAANMAVSTLQVSSLQCLITCAITVPVRRQSGQQLHWSGQSPRGRPAGGRDDEDP